MLEDFFLDNVRETILAYERRCADKGEKFARGDNFSVVSSQNLGMKMDSNDKNTG